MVIGKHSLSTFSSFVGVCRALSINESIDIILGPIDMIKFIAQGRRSPGLCLVLLIFLPTFQYSKMIIDIGG